MASAIEKPLRVDMQTEKMRMISYARVCVEIKAIQKLLDFVDVILNDETWAFKVEYKWRPVSCMDCGTFSHRCAPTIKVPYAILSAPAAVIAKDALSLADGTWKTVRKRRGVAHPTSSALAPSLDLGLISLDPIYGSKSVGVQSLPDPNTSS